MRVVVLASTNVVPWHGQDRERTIITSYCCHAAVAQSKVQITYSYRYGSESVTLETITRVNDNTPAVSSSDDRKGMIHQPATGQAVSLT